MHTSTAYLKSNRKFIQQFNKVDYLLFAIILNNRMLFDLFVRLSNLFNIYNDLFADILRGTSYILLFTFLLYRLVIKHKIVTQPLLFMYFISIIIVFSLLLNYELLRMIKIQVILTFSSSVPFFFAAYYGSQNPRLFLHYFDKFTILAVIYALNILLFPDIRDSGFAVGYQALSYHLLPFAILVFWKFTYKKNKIQLLYFALFIYVIFAYGGRGPLLILVISILLVLFMNIKVIQIKIILAFILTVVTTSIYLFWDNILIYLTNLMPYSRNLAMLRNQSFQTMDSRTNIFEYLNSFIIESPLIMRGFGGNHFLVNDFYSSNGYVLELTATHAHNFLYALIIDWGVIVGSFIIFIIFIKIIKTIKIVLLYKNSYLNIAFILLVLVNILHSMISGSYSTGGEVWISLGMIFAYSKIKNIGNSVTYEEHITK